MSSDDGVYILVTAAKNGKEYRVAWAQAIENIWYEGTYGQIDGTDEDSGCDGLNIESVVEIFGQCEVFTDRAQAAVAALDMNRHGSEYGVEEFDYSHVSFPTVMV